MADRSGRVTFRRAVLKTRSGECQRLSDVFRSQLGIVPEKVVPVWADRHGFHNPADRQPHTTDARLPIHVVRVPRYPIEELHRFDFDTFRRQVLPGVWIPAGKRAFRNVIHSARQSARMGLKTFSPAKSLSFSVTITQSFASAIAAMIMSSGLRGRPFAVPSAISRAQIEAGLFIEREHPAGEQRLRALGTGKPTLQLPALLSGGLLQNSAPDLSDCHGEEINRSSSACSAIHATSASDGAGLVTLLMMLVSRRLRLTGQPCGPASTGRLRSRSAPTRGDRRNASRMPPFFGGSAESVRRTVARIRAESGSVAGQSLRERPDQVAIGVQPKNLEPSHPSLAKALPVAFTARFCGVGAHRRIPSYIQIIRSAGTDNLLSPSQVQYSPQTPLPSVERRDAANNRCLPKRSCANILSSAPRDSSVVS